MWALSSVDELACYMDSAAEPNAIHMEVRLAGRVDPAGLRGAVLEALRAHPRARVRRRPVKGWHRRFYWEVAETTVEPVDEVGWRDEAELAHHRADLMNTTPALDAAPPVRIRLANGPDMDVLIMSTHHAAMDGLSCLRLLRSVANRYAGRPDPVGEEPAPLPRPHTDPPRSLRKATLITPDTAAPGPGTGFHLVSLPLNQTPGGTGTVNDLLIAALVRTIGTGSIRITMPVNARAPGSEAIGNLSRLTVITLDGDEPLADITRQTQIAKETSAAQIDRVSRMLATPLLPVVLKRRLVTTALKIAGTATSDTALLSNLGVVNDPPDFGPDAPVAGLWMSSPVRMPRGLSLGAVTVRDQLHLCFRYRRALFDEAAAARFADNFTRNLFELNDPRFGKQGDAAAGVGS